MIKVGIVGSAGYTAGELFRLLVHHPQVQIDFAYSTSNAGNPVSSVHQDLLGTADDLFFTDEVNPQADMVFLCLGHGHSKEFLQKNPFSPQTKIIDLGNDFRLINDAVFGERTFVYGLPEFQKEAIRQAKNIANPGCFATAIQLALLPLADAGLLSSDVHIQAVTGSTGAGVSLSETSHFSWRESNFSYYKPFTHQHLGEIGETLKTEMPSFASKLWFMPFRGNFTRGIFATLYTDFDGSENDATDLYRAFYENSAFTFVSEKSLHLKQVVNTNKAFVHLHKHEDKLLITSCIDNLLKGASGQAVQNMNLMYNLPEKTGLELKAGYF
ncbi:MAG: N-acetyl-gamma-glutamyl-phosphate reductase [Capnocytophaga sp.]|nr:N-acetyl-gamma-glutamyl-phosphate reductase [Capnocytophaga sp.]